VRPDGTPDQLLGAIRNLSPRDFEQLTAELPDRWPAMLAEVGLVVGAPGTGVILKARWQNLPRSVRSELATALGAVADRLAASGEVSARIAALAAAFTAIAGERRAPRSGPEPGVLAELLATATTVADATVEAAMAALSQGRPCPEDLPRAVREYNEAMAAARQLLADAGVDPLPEGRSAILAGLEEMAAAAAREPVRAAVAALAEVRSELAVLREARRRAAELLEVEVAEWDEEQLRLAQGLATVVELRRIATAGNGPTELLATSARAEAMLPQELHGLTILAVSASFPLIGAEPSGVAVA
jgi:hypothetical protein